MRELTNNDSWGLSPSQMFSVCQEAGCGDTHIRQDILGVLRERMESSDSTWRNIYKALMIYEYCLLHGSLEGFLNPLKEDRGGEEIMADMKTLHDLEFDYHYIDSQGKDQGINVRTRAKAILTLLQDWNGELQNARNAAHSNRSIMFTRRGTKIIEHKGQHQRPQLFKGHENVNLVDVATTEVDFQPKREQEEEMEEEFEDFQGAETTGLHTEDDLQSYIAAHSNLVDI